MRACAEFGRFLPETPRNDGETSAVGVQLLDFLLRA
jgi:hypothetical protein